MKANKVLVIGGTGFIGSRLVERLILKHVAAVRVLVKNYYSATRICRFPVELVSGDVMNFESLRRAMKNCEVVFNCSYGNSGSPKERRTVTVDGAKSIAKSVIAENVSRLVHVSTVSVYGNSFDGDLDEKSPRQTTGDLYGDTKLEAEKLMIDFHKKANLPVTVIQPTIVYGPFAGWTIGPLKDLKIGNFALVNGGKGLCNAVYIDDLVDGLILAAQIPQAVGESFLISAENPVTWHDFYSKYEHMLNIQSTVHMSLNEILNAHRKKKKYNSSWRCLIRTFRHDAKFRHIILGLPGISHFHRSIRYLSPENFWRNVRKMIVYNSNDIVDKRSGSIDKPLILPKINQLHLYKSKTRVVINKAKDLLGYSPKFDLENGMQLTSQWAKWANIL